MAPTLGPSTARTGGERTPIARAVERPGERHLRSRHETSYEQSGPATNARQPRCVPVAMPGPPRGECHEPLRPRRIVERGQAVGRRFSRRHGLATLRLVHAPPPRREHLTSARSSGKAHLTREASRLTAAASRRAPAYPLVETEAGGVKRETCDFARTTHGEPVDPLEPSVTPAV